MFRIAYARLHLSGGLHNKCAFALLGVRARALRAIVRAATTPTVCVRRLVSRSRGPYLLLSLRLAAGDRGRGPMPPPFTTTLWFPEKLKGGGIGPLPSHVTGVVACLMPFVMVSAWRLN